MQYKPMIITEEEQASFDAATTCWICGGETIDDDGGLGKVRDHCHFTGKYRGAAHNKCNLKMGKDKTIPVVFHNGSRYDFSPLREKPGKDRRSYQDHCKEFGTVYFHRQVRLRQRKKIPGECSS